MLGIDDLWRLAGIHDVIWFLVSDTLTIYDLNVVASCITGVWASSELL